MEKLTSGQAKGLLPCAGRVVDASSRGYSQAKHPAGNGLKQIADS